MLPNDVMASLQVVGLGGNLLEEQIASNAQCGALSALDSLAASAGSNPRLVNSEAAGHASRLFFGGAGDLETSSE